jgi:transcriptional regulator with XRE-family HTH domain
MDAVNAPGPYDCQLLSHDLPKENQLKRSKPKPARQPVKPPAKPVVAAPPRADGGPNLGECLRAIRFRRRLSIADVSVATGLARSTLSRVEKDQLSLTYDRLLQLCRGLQIDLTELFSSQSDVARQAMTRRAYTPPGGGRSVPVGEHVYSYLCTDLPRKKMTPMTAEIRARTFAETNGFLRHEGEEFAYVIEGTLELHTEFYQPLRVETGGSVYFDSTMGHTYVSLGEAPAKILCVCSAVESTLTQALLDSGDSASGTAAAPASPKTSRAPRRTAKARA